jgi:SOS-response transcriptional repressor LexA
MSTAKDSVRPTKKQRELLTFIEQFILEHGYGPSYREIMVGCDYSSVATVAVHVNNLINRGHLTKRDRSARSLEVVKKSEIGKTPQVKVTAVNEKWLADAIEVKFQEIEKAPKIKQGDIDKLYVLTGALSVLGFDGAAVAFKSKLKELEK